MSVNAPGLTQLRDYANEKLGKEFFLGIVGDTHHTSGYHLGPDRIQGADPKTWHAAFAQPVV